MDVAAMNLVQGLRLALDGTRPDVVAIVGGGGKSSLLFRLAAEISARIDAGGKRVIMTSTTRLGVDQLSRAPAVVLVAAGASLPWDEIARALDAHRQCLLMSDEILFGTMQKGIDVVQVDALVAGAARLGVAAVLVEADGSRARPVKAPAAHEPVIPAQTTLVICMMGMDAIGVLLAEPHVHRPAQMRAVLGLSNVPARLSPLLAARLLADVDGGRKHVPVASRFVVMLNKAEGAVVRATARVVANLLAERGINTLIARLGVADASPVLERWGVMGALVLAAGEAKRFAAPKQVARIQQQSLLARAVRLAHGSGAQQITVVTGAYEQAVRAAMDELPAEMRARTMLQHNPQWATGQASSLRAGVQSLGELAQAVICLPVDQPFTDAALLRRLYAAWRVGADLAAPLVEGELRGAPALFDRQHFAALQQIDGDRGGRVLLQARRADVVTIPAAPESLLDIDTADDLAVAQRRGSAANRDTNNAQTTGTT